MWNLTRSRIKRIASVALVAGAIVFAAAVPGETQAMIGHGGRPVTSAGRRVSDGHRLGDSERQHNFDRDRNHAFGGGRGIYRRYPYYSYYYPYYYSAPTYWYYCPSYGAYYPYVSSCPEGWVPVPAS